MSVRNTSKVTYGELIQEGFVSDLQQEVYELVSENYGLTDRELCRIAGIKDPNHLRPRRNELCKLGLIEEVSKRKCTLSGRIALTWKVKELTTWNLVKGNHPKDKQAGATIVREVKSKSLQEFVIKISLYFISYPNEKYGTKLMKADYVKGVYVARLERIEK